MSDQSMPVALLGWKPLAKGSLRGFAKVRLGRSLVINGQPMRDNKGKQRFSPILEWADRDASDRFSLAVVEAITREHGASALEVAL